MSKYSRRGILRGMGWGLAGAATNMSDLFLKSFIDGLSYQAYAQSLSSDPRVYLAIRATGAPARWAWDQFLNPNGETVLPNLSVATHFDSAGGRLINPIYGTYNHNGLIVPHTWSFQVPRAGGGTRPMTDLLDNMLVLRGVDVLDNGHPGAQKKQYMMPGHPYSIQGAVADHSKTPFPTIMTGSNSNEFNLDFVSKEGHQLVKSFLNSNNKPNLIKDLLKPFTGNESLESRQIASTYNADIHRAINALNLTASDYTQTLRNNIKGADELIRQGFGDLDASWTALVTKYQDLIDRAIHQGNYPGINDMPVGDIVGNRNDNYNFYGPIKIVDLPDLRSMVTSSSGLGMAADQFAMAEFMIKNGYTKSIILDLPPLDGLAYEAADLTKTGRLQHDQHFNGQFITTFLSAYMFSAFSACLIELIEQFKAHTTSDGKNLFNETVIQFGGEFNRTAPSHGRGTDHADSASSFTQWSGAINGNHIVGNVLDQPLQASLRNGGAPGSWGIGAKITEFGGQRALTGNVLSTMSHLLRVPTPSPNNISMVNVVNGQVSSLIGNAKTVPYQEDGQ